MEKPIYGSGVYLAAGAQVHGDVQLGENVSVWHNAVLRGDTAPIRVGAGSNLQDGCILHVNPARPLQVGRGVSVGHGAILHGCTVGDDTVVGMGAILLDGCQVGSGCIIGAGALVTGGSVIPDGMMAFGSPARPVRPLTPEETAHNRENARHYCALARAALQRQAEEEKQSAADANTQTL